MIQQRDDLHVNLLITGKSVENKQTTNTGKSYHYISSHIVFPAKQNEEKCKLHFKWQIYKCQIFSFSQGEPNKLSCHARSGQMQASSKIIANIKIYKYMYTSLITKNDIHRYMCTHLITKLMKSQKIVFFYSTSLMRY